MRSGAVDTTATPSPIASARRLRRCAYTGEIASAFIYRRPSSLQLSFQFGEALDGPDILPQPFVELAAELAAPRRVVEQRRERRFIARLDRRDQRRLHQRHAGISVARPRLVADHAMAQREVTFVLMGWVRYQNQVCESFAERDLAQAHEIAFAVD